MPNTTHNSVKFWLQSSPGTPFGLSPVVLGAMLLIPAVLLHFMWSRGRKQPPGTEPIPGPKGLPIVGSLLDMPKQFAWLKFHEYIQEYGPIVRLNIMGQEHILLGNEAIVDDLVNGRGSIYSGRPQTQAASILSQGQHMLMLQAGQPLTVRRRFLSHLLTRSAAPQYEPYQWLETYRMVVDIVRDPSDYQSIFQHWSMAMGSRMLYGQAMHDRNGPQIGLVDVLQTHEHVLTPGAFLVDFIPWMRFLPDFVAPWKRWLKRMAMRDQAFYYQMWNLTKSSLDNGRDAPSWTRLCIEDLQQAAMGGKSMGLSEVEAVHLMGVTYTAFDTTVANMTTLMLAVTRHPEWWLRMQAEMDAVVGADRLPTLKDLPQLPVLRAVLSEMARFWPVTPNGVPHELTKDDVYKGYHLKAGSVIHLVSWSCGRDPELYPDPETFNPYRWLDPKFPSYKEPLTEYPTLNNTLMFGAGRRKCPGMIVGARNIYIQTMLLVWACDVGRARDQVTGEEIVPPLYEIFPGLNVHPKPFKFDLKPRSMDRKSMVDAAYDRALKEDSMA